MDCQDWNCRVLGVTGIEKWITVYAPKTGDAEGYLRRFFDTLGYVLLEYRYEV